jgi:hypothetical protein
MTSAQIKKMQTRIGTTPDGFWGPKSIAACQAHLSRLMQEANPWPRPNVAALAESFGEPGDESNLVAVSVDGLGVEYDGTPVRSIRCNKRVAASLARVLAKIAQSEHSAILKEYAGVFNFRKKRGGTSFSLHAYGAAIDLDPGNNGMRDSWPMRSTMPLEVIEMFATEGWKSGGAWWGYDAMHFETTR